MNISNSILAETDQLPPLGDVMYQYVVAGNGLFIRAEDSRMRALVPIAPARCHGLAELVPIAALADDVVRVPGAWLKSVLASARRKMPLEAMYQFWLRESGVGSGESGEWRCSMPVQAGSPTALHYDDLAHAVIDLHSHNSMPAFFSSTDDADEQGLRFYAVIGRIETERPEIRVRVGVYGHHMEVPADMVFDDLGPFVDQLSVDSSQSSDEDTERQCRVCGCTESHGCENGCFWVEDDLCSNCGPVPDVWRDLAPDLVKVLDGRLNR